MHVKHLKLPAVTFDIPMIAKTLESIDIPEQSIPGLSAETPLCKKHIRDLFQEIFKNSKFDLSRVSGAAWGEYKDPQVEAAYMAFKFTVVQNRTSIHRALRNLGKDSVQGPYIVGMQVADGTVQFGYRPYKHNTAAKAIAQAEILRERNNKSYTIFGVVDTVVVKDGRKELVDMSVEATKQGVGGKLVRGPFKVMADWQKIIKENDITAVNIPVSVGFLANGKHCVSFSMTQEMVCFDEYKECIRFLDNWIKDYRSNYPEQTLTHPEQPQDVMSDN